MLKTILEFLFGTKLKQLSSKRNAALATFDKMKQDLLDINDQAIVHEQELKADIDKLMSKISLKNAETEALKILREANEKLHNKIHEFLS